jgi:serine phosphatase RsbU (regulator of sigma subunit)
VSAWVVSHPAEENENCGDFASVIPLRAGRHAIIVGDVAGRGTAVADVAASLFVRVRNLMAVDARLCEVLHAAHASFVRTMMTEAIPFTSLFVAVIDRAASMLRYASAGHEPALLFAADRATHHHLNPTGPVLGIRTSPVFRQRKVHLSRGDTLVAVTDGITEARRADGFELDFFGTRGVVHATREAVRDGRDPARAIFDAAKAHAGGRLTDDASVAVAMASSPVVLRLPVRTAR